MNNVLKLPLRHKAPAHHNGQAGQQVVDAEGSLVALVSHEASEGVLAGDLAQHIADCINGAHTPSAPGAHWRLASDPPAGNPSRWTRDVVVVTNFGNVARTAFMHGDDGRPGVWQRPGGFLKHEQVALWCDMPTTAEIRSERCEQPAGLSEGVVEELFLPTHVKKVISADQLEVGQRVTLIPSPSTSTRDSDT